MRAGILILVAVFLAGLIGLTRDWLAEVAETERKAAELTGGHPRLGRDAMVSLGCVACHQVPGFFGTKPRVGPPLAEFALRTFIAGTSENTPENLVRFIRDPRSIAPRSAMPKLPMSDAQARDLAAFLYTLQ
jgi:cytochrome c